MTPLTDIGVRPGQIYWAEPPDIRRGPVIVVSRPIFNQRDFATVVPVSTKRLEKRWNLPNSVLFDEETFGLPKLSVAIAEDIGLMETIHLGDSIGVLNEEYFAKLVRAIGHVICADCRPDL